MFAKYNSLTGFKSLTVKRVIKEMNWSRTELRCKEHSTIL